MLAVRTAGPGDKAAAALLLPEPEGLPPAGWCCLRARCCSCFESLMTGRLLSALRLVASALLVGVRFLRRDEGGDKTALDTPTTVRVGSAASEAGVAGRDSWPTVELEGASRTVLCVTRCSSDWRCCGEMRSRMSTPSMPPRLLDIMDQTTTTMATTARRGGGGHNESTA